VRPPGGVVGELGDAGAGLDEGAAAGVVADDVGVLGGQGWAELVVVTRSRRVVTASRFFWARRAALKVTASGGVPSVAARVCQVSQRCWWSGPVEVGGVDELVEVGAEVWVVDEGGEEGAFGFAVGDGWSCSAGSDVVVGVERWLWCLGHARLSQPVVGGVGLVAGEEAGCGRGLGSRASEPGRKAGPVLLGWCAWCPSFLLGLTGLGRAVGRRRAASAGRAGGVDSPGRVVSGGHGRVLELEVRVGGGASSSSGRSSSWAWMGLPLGPSQMSQSPVPSSTNSWGWSAASAPGGRR
jgi:hypothetical protein